MTPENGDLLIKIERFAREAEDIRFLGLIGSSSNDGDLSDEYSDIDLVMATNDVAPYFNGDTWLGRIDDVWVTFTESAPDINYWERRCVFKNGLDVDFIIVDKKKLVSGNERFPVLNDVCRKTLRALVDKDQLKHYFDGLVIDQKEHAQPTQEHYDNVVGYFYFHCVWALKKCLRGEYWVELQNIFSAYGKDALITALMANEGFFSKIAKETAARNGFEFPSSKIDSLTRWIKETV